MKVSELYGKTITGANGKRKGFILAISCNQNTVAGLICCDESEKTFFVAGEDVLSLCGETRFLKTGKAQKNTASLKLGKAVYSSQGKFLGHLEDCILNGLKITHAVVGGKKIPFNNLIFGDVCIVKSKTKTVDFSAELAAKNMFIQAVCADGGEKH